MTGARILVNAVAARTGGGPNHLAPFVLSLADQLDEAAIDVIVTPDFPYAREHERVTWLVHDVPRGITARRLRWDLVEVPRLAAAYDAVVSPLNFGPVRCPRPHVVMQRNTLYFDPVASQDVPWRARLQFAGFRRFAIAVSNAADHVFVPSATMRDLLVPHLRDASKVEIARHGVDVAEIRRQSAGPLLSAAVAWSQAPVRLLHVGHPSPHKNYRSLAHQVRHVIDDLGESQVALAVTTRADAGNAAIGELLAAARSLGVTDNIHFLGPVPQPEVFSLYGHADVVLFPSHTESFGFPLLEAFAVGVPVVGSDIAAFREVGGGLALLHAPDDTEGAARLVVKALGGDDDARDELRQHAATFDISDQTALVARRLRESIARS